jgi:hypothetical protein
MSPHAQHVSAADARQALGELTTVVARAFGQSHAKHLRTLDLFLKQHEEPVSQAKPSKTTHKDAELPSVPK